jgi:CelD/BcsL family acetyltransferase involved in cellulose biosynthesis
MSLTTQQYSNSSSFIELAQDWHELLAKTTAPHIFQTPEFTQTWWDTLGTGELSIITIRDEQEILVGLAPFFLTQNDSNSTLSFLGCSDVTDYQDFLVDPAVAEQVYDELFKFLSAKYADTTISLCSLPNSSATLEYAKTHFAAELLTVTQQDVVPLLPLPSTWEEYLDSLDRKQRHELRRKWGKLERETSHEFSVVTEPEQTPQAVGTFIELHKASSPGKERFWDDHHVKFFTALTKKFAQAEWLKLFFLSIENQPAAVMLIFDYHKRYYLYNSGYNPEYYRELGTGNTLLAYTIKHAIEHNRSVYDFLRGEEAYKFRFGAVAEPVWDLELKK